jgi:hypothetical protein
MSIRRFPLRRNDALCLVAILALATIFLAPALRPGYTLLPLGLESGIAPWHKQVPQQAQNLLLSDPFYTFYPRRHFFTVSLQRGAYPLWNPYIFSGHPVAGDVCSTSIARPGLVPHHPHGSLNVRLSTPPSPPARASAFRRSGVDAERQHGRLARKSTPSQHTRLDACRIPVL